MGTVRTIAIIGATEEGAAAIVRSLAKNNVRLLLIANDHQKASALKDRLENDGAKAELLVMECAREASWEADMIVIATPYDVYGEIAGRIRPVATGKVVISIPGRAASCPGTSAAEELQKLLPYSKIVKTFNTEVISPLTGGNQPELLIAGNSGDAVDAVADLVRSTGLRPVVVGDLTLSRELEAMPLKVLNLAIKRKSGWPGHH
ncbi:MAG TPA: NAD(P)-binding domain-containing protein [Chryseosolibacter sp.]